MRVAIIGDVHLSTTPRRRTDDYFEAIQMKLQWLADNHDAIVCAGDLFEKPIFSSMKQLVRLVNFFGELKVPFYTIIGNHDLYNANHSNLWKTSLGLLEYLNLVTIIREPIQLEGLTISGAHYAHDMDWPKNSGPWQNSMLIAHAWYQDCSKEPNVTLTEELVKDLKYEYYFLGHDHEPRKLKRVGRNKVYRTGSICRYYAHQYNLQRTPKYLCLHVEAGGIVSAEVKTVEAARPPEDVFDPILFTAPEHNALGALDNIAEVLEQYQKMASSIGGKFSVESALDSLQCPSNVCNYINQFLPEKERMAMREVPTLQPMESTDG